MDKPMNKRMPRGPKRTFNTCEDLLKAAEKYFTWCEKNPLYSQKSQYDTKLGEWKVIAEPKLRATTLIGLCHFIGIDTETFRRYRTGELCNGDLKEAAVLIDEMIYKQKFEGAAADMLNSSFIGRDLGLADKKEIKANISLDEDPVFE